MYKIDNEVFRILKARIRALEPSRAVTPFQDATMGPFQTFGIAILTLEDEDGTIGEAPVFSSYNNILESFILPILLHNQNLPYSELYPQLYWSIRNEGFRGQASALLGQIDLALYDLAARRHKVPLHKYLNAERNCARFYGSGGGTNYSLKELETELSVFLEAGADCYKMKVGKDFGAKMKEDVERVKFVRQLMGKDIKLAVDANKYGLVSRPYDLLIWQVERIWPGLKNLFIRLPLTRLKNYVAAHQSLFHMGNRSEPQELFQHW
jgi:L-alanine-DL-glutamate epimerase-like enolase superfamily enzyme